MKAIEGYRLIMPDDLTWKPSPMQVPNAGFPVRTGSENLVAGSEAGRLILTRDCRWQRGGVR